MNKKIVLSIIFGLLFICEISGQITFQRTFSIYDYGHSVKQTFDDGYIITGGYGDFFLIKTDPNGDTVWTRTFEAVPGTTDNHGNSVIQTSDSGYIIAGSIFVSALRGYDVVLIKTNSAGDTMWTKAIGDTSDERGNSIEQTTDGGFIITGYTKSFGAGNYDIYLIKTDSNGTILWTKTFGGSGYDYGNSVQQVADGGYIITGQCGGGYPDAILIRTDSAGNLVWSKTYGGTATDVGLSVEQTADGGYIVAGETFSFGAGSADIYLIKTDSIGDTFWTKTYGQVNADIGNQVKQTSDNGFIIIGSTNKTAHGFALLIKINSIGDTLWAKRFRITEGGGESVQQTADGGFVFTGHSWNYVTAHTDIYLVKTNANGKSGCFQHKESLLISSPPTQVSDIVMTVSSGGTIAAAPITITSRNTGIATHCTTLGADEMEKEYSFFISPNPSHGDLEIKFPGMIKHGKIDFYNCLGEKLYSAMINYESTKTMTFKNMVQGIYFVNVFDGENSYCKKLIIEQD